MLGSALVAGLAPVGPRLGVPSIVAARAALGREGASALALLLYLTNFAWIAVNNVIAASVLSRTIGGDERAWSVAMGVVATAVVAAGPRAVGRADRVAVPLMAAAGVVFLWRCLALPPAAPAAAPAPAAPLGALRGLDVVIAYQASWILMFADYSRFTASATQATLATFLGLALTSLWFMPLGLLAGRAAGSADPGAMVAAVGAGTAGGALLALGTLTTNFVNVYLSGLAWKSLFPGASPRATVWTIGGVGTLLGVVSRAWLDRFAELMLVLGGVLVPVGGILLARFFTLPLPADVRALYGGEPAPRRLVAAGAIAWLAGAAAYYAAGPWGGTLPSLLTAAVSYRLLAGRPPGGGVRS